MKFIIEGGNNKKYNEALFRATAKNFIVISQSNLGATEKLLDKYLIEKYRLPLFLACLKIVESAKYSLNGNNEMVISFPEKDIDKLASIITFGTGGKIQGSNILKLAFGHKL